MILTQIFHGVIHHFIIQGTVSSAQIGYCVRLDFARDGFSGHLALYYKLYRASLVLTHSD